MLKYKHYFILLVIIVFVFNSLSFGCSLGITLPIEFDSSLYIFTGEVVDIAGPLKLSKDITERTSSDNMEAWGVKVRVEQRMNTPKQEPDVIEVYTLGLGSDCSYWGFTKEEVLKQFSIGSKVKVVAPEVKNSSDSQKQSTLKLLTTNFFGNLSLNESKDLPSTSPSSVFDYEQYHSYYLGLLKSPKWGSDEVQRQIGDYMSLAYFEYNKDLIRLKNAQSQEEINDIVRRLAYFPTLNLVYDKMLEHYIKDKQLQEKFSKLRNEFRVDLDSKN